MDNGERDKATQNNLILMESRREQDPPITPWQFRHDDLIRALDSASILDKKKLTNTLNYIHFMGKKVHVLLMHPIYEEEIIVSADPDPCMGEELTCRWHKAYTDYNLERYRFQHLLIVHNQAVIVVPAELIAMGSDALVLRLPESSRVLSERQAPRFVCCDVRAELWQNGFQAEGELVDFNPHAFRISVEPAAPSSFHWFNHEVPSTIRLSNGKDVYYSGNCKCINADSSGRRREIVLTPLSNQIQRFKSRRVRNPRQRPQPPFNAVFEHPFFKKKIQREILDISTSGFSILDRSDNVVLMPGMIIPGINIVYAGIINIQCKGQVIYFKEEEEGKIRLGIAILDMDLINYNNLNQILNNIKVTDTSTFNEVDMEELWEFFFDTDFIYPKKYKIIQTFKEDFRETYRKLYEESPEVAKHFVYQCNGRIYGHISILRAYERAWMVHHLAARPLGGRPIGLSVMKLLISYINDLRRLPSANMDYIIIFFRPENKFMGKFFGGFAKELSNPHQCSLDLFTYLTYPKRTEEFDALPPGWIIRESSPSDLWEFEQFYRNSSDGLFGAMLNAKSWQDTECLTKVCTRKGFTRTWKTFALFHRNELKAFIVDDESDVGINLADLLNGFKIFVTDPRLPTSILFAAISRLTKNQTRSLPLMIYNNYENLGDIGYEKKQYFLWILDAQYTNEYLDYVEKKFRIKFV